MNTQSLLSLSLSSCYRIATRKLSAAMGWGMSAALLAGVAVKASAQFPVEPVTTGSTTQIITVTVPVGTVLNATTPVTVVTTGITGLDFTFVAGGSCTAGKVIAPSPNNSCTVDVAFAPTEPGLRLGAVNVFGAASATTPVATVLLNGVGTGPLSLFTAGVNSYLSGFGPQLGPLTVVTDAAGNVYWGNSNGIIVKYTASTMAIANYSNCPGGSPGGLAVDGAGDLYCAATGSNLLYEAVAGSTVFGAVATLPAAATSGMAVDFAGNIYVGGSSGNIYAVAAGSAHTVSTLPSIGGTSISGIAADNNGYLYVANQTSNIYRINIATSAVTTLITDAVNLQGAYGLVLDAAGDLYATNRNSGFNVVRYQNTGTYLAPAYSTTSATVLSGLTSGAAGIAIDGPGNLYTAYDQAPFGGSGIYKYTRSTTPGLSFVSQTINTTSPTQYVEVENDGNLALTYSSIASAVPFTFSGGTAPVCTTSLPAGGTCFGAATFHPTVAGPANGTGTFTDNSLNVATSTQTVSFYGSTTASAGVTPQTINFPQPPTPVIAGAMSTLTATSSSTLGVVYTVVSGNATIIGNMITYNAPGTVVIAANQGGNATYAAASQVTRTVTVNPDPTTTVVTSSLNPSTYAASVTFTATVTSTTAGAINGTATFYDNGTSIGTGTVTNGVATFATSILAVGTHPITVTYTPAGGSNYGTSTSTPALSQVVNADPTTTTVTSSLNPSTYATSLTFTANVTSTTAGAINGTATFYDNGTSIGTGTVTNGVATFATSTLAVGTHPIRVTYAPAVGSNYATSTSTPALSQVVNADPTTTTVTSTPNPSTYGGNVTFTITVTSTTPGAINGSVTYYDNGAMIGSGSVINGAAGFSTSTLTAGTHPITATYTPAGGSTYAGSTSAPDQQVVNPAPTTTKVTSSLNPSIYSNTVTFTATVTSTAPGTINGTATFYDNGVSIGTGPVTAGVGTFSISTLTVGTHPITATYAPASGSNYAGSTSTPALLQVVNAITTTTVLTTSAPNQISGQPVTFTATVTGTTGPVPTGTVSFCNGTCSPATLLATQTLNAAGVATFTTSTLPDGVLTINAVYSPDAFHLGSTGTVSQMISDFSLSSTTPTLTVDPTAVANFNITVTPYPGTNFTGTVTFSVTGLPPNSTASFSPPTVVPGTAVVTSTLSVQTYAQVLAQQRQHDIWGRYGTVALSFLLLPVLGLKRFRKRLSKTALLALFAIISLGMAVPLTGCGAGYFGPPPTSGVLTVTGSDGTLQHSTTVTLNVR